MLKFEDALERCIDCEQSWFVRDTLDFWYPYFRNWINEKNCAIVPDGLDPFQKVIHPGIFLSCLKEWINDDYFGKIYSEDIKFSADGWQINGFKARIDITKLESLAIEGVQMLEDLRRIEKDYGLTETNIYFRFFMDIE